MEIISCKKEQGVDEAMGGSEGVCRHSGTAIRAVIGWGLVGMGGKLGKLGDAQLGGQVENSCDLSFFIQRPELFRLLVQIELKLFYSANLYYQLFVHLIFLSVFITLVLLLISSRNPHGQNPSNS